MTRLYDGTIFWGCVTQAVEIDDIFQHIHNGLKGTWDSLISSGISL